jgi:hypothetical protein
MTNTEELEKILREFYQETKALEDLGVAFAGEAQNYTRATNAILDLIANARIDELRWVNHNIGEMGITWLENRLAELSKDRKG